MPRTPRKRTVEQEIAAKYKPLTPREQLFVDHYLVTRDASAAAVAAGSTSRTPDAYGRRMLAKSHVKRQIDASVTKIAQAAVEKAQIDAQYVLRNAVEMFERLKDEVRPILNRHGEPVLHEGKPVFTLSQAATAARFLEMVGRHAAIGAFVERVEVSSSVTDVLLAGRARFAASQRTIEAEAEAQIAREIQSRPKAALIEFVRPGSGSPEAIEAAHMRRDQSRNTPVAPATQSLER